MLCPSDRCRIWKQGPSIRIDTTLVGYDRLSWQRGNVTFLFKVGDDGSQFYLLDHDKKQWEEVNQLHEPSDEDLEIQVNLALNTEIVQVEVNQRPLKEGEAGRGFDRQQAGFFGMGGDREDTIGGYRTAVWDIPDIEVVTRKRREHLRDRPDAATLKRHLTSEGLGEAELEERLARIEDEETKEEIGGYLEATLGTSNLTNWFPSLPKPTEPDQTQKDAFFSNPSGPYQHHGRPLDLHTSHRTIHPAVWMADPELFPLKLAHLLPVFEILSPTAQHFDRLQEFIRMDMPEGFPVRLEVPIFGFLTGRVTFENCWGWMEGLGAEAIPSPKALGEDKHTRAWFELPKGYEKAQIIKSYLNKDNNSNKDKK